MKLLGLSRSLLLFFLLLAGLSQVQATAIRQVNLDEMLRRSELVFDGKVTHVQVQENEYGRLMTAVTFQVLDVLKGDPGGPTLTLFFMGGEKDGKVLKVGDMDYPAPGERGIYFVESRQRRLVNPLYGWSQGRFRVIKDDDGTLRVYTAKETPVTGLVTPSPQSSPQLSLGVARGVLSSKRPLNKKALPLEQFKRQLQQKWETLR